VWSWSFNTSDGPDESQTVSITATDSDGAATTTTFELVIENVAPEFLVVAHEADSFESRSSVGTFIHLNGAFVDSGSRDSHEILVDWNDGSEMESISVNQDNYTFDGQHRYEQGGIYHITITLNDDDGGSVTSQSVVYVTGYRLDAEGVFQVVASERNDLVHVKLKNENGKRGLPDRTFLEIDLKWYDDSGNKNKPNIEKIEYDLDQVEKIYVMLGGGNDHFQMDKGIFISAEIYGGAGDDHLTGGAGDNRLVGGEGRDKIKGGGGSD
jgi:hypothetical protein